jgi:hypothetical protein
MRSDRLAYVRKYLLGVTCALAQKPRIAEAMSARLLVPPLLTLLTLLPPPLPPPAPTTPTSTPHPTPARPEDAFALASLVARPADTLLNRVHTGLLYF